MAELEQVIEALNAYRGDTETLDAFVRAAEADLGPDWAEEILNVTAGWEPALAEKLNHAYNYYAATASWNEVQGYLTDDNPDTAVIAERLPVLEHWLAFFGEAGAEPIRQLRDRLNPPERLEPQTVIDPDAVLEKMLGRGPIEKPLPVITEKGETAEEFLVRQAFQDIDLLDRVQAWTAARCVELGNIEVYAYKFYGFQVDLMEHAKQAVSGILEDPVFYPLVEAAKENGLDYLRGKLKSLETDIQVAYDNAQTDVTPLVDVSTNAAAARELLGALDTSNSKEFLGPAPDGFEIVDDPYTELDEEQVAKAYNQLEQKVSSMGEKPDVKPVSEKTAPASGGVGGRKMSFSLGNKTVKPKA